MAIRLGTLDDFDRVLTANGLIVIVDSANGIKLHALPCRWVTRGNFETKVVINGGRNGSYFTVESRADALERFGAALRECATCGSGIDTPRSPRAAAAAPGVPEAMLSAPVIVGGSTGNKGPVRMGSHRTLPFEPKGDMLELRTRIRGAVATLVGGPGEIFWGTLHADATSLPSGVDVENVLFYNVGAGAFAGVQHAGLAWESAPPVANGTHTDAWPVVVEYAVHSDARGFAHWAAGEAVITFRDIALPRLSSVSKPAWVWRAVHEARGIERRGVEELEGAFGLDLELRMPGAWRVPVIGIVKPLIDGLVAALHAHDGSEPDILADRLSSQLGEGTEVVRTRLGNQALAILGVRRLLWSRQGGVQWNPGDDRCRAARIRVVTGEGDGLRLSGSLFAVSPRPAGPAR